jgi:hypothetical protein
MKTSENKTEKTATKRIVQLNIDVEESDRRNLKVLAALRGEPMKDMVTRWVRRLANTDELNRITTRDGNAGVRVVVDKGKQADPNQDGPTRSPSGRGR